jgi:hypothetical protein
LSVDAILKTTNSAGYDLVALRPRLEARDKTADAGIGKVPTHDVLIVGAGAAGISAVFGEFVAPIFGCDKC